jgi:phosphatidylglycerophosphatase A
MNFLIKLIASGLGTGYFPIAPGTAGSALAVGVALCLRHWWNPSGALALCCTCFLAGVYCTTRAEKFWGHDSGKMVIDEITGMFLPLAFIPLNWTNLFVAFLIFRLLDITKPPPARQLERLRAGWGVMADDIVAGAYTAVLMLGIEKWM